MSWKLAGEGRREVLEERGEALGVPFSVPRSLFCSLPLTFSSCSSPAQVPSTICRPSGAGDPVCWADDQTTQSVFVKQTSGPTCHLDPVG